MPDHITRVREQALNRISQVDERYMAAVWYAAGAVDLASRLTREKIKGAIKSRSEWIDYQGYGLIGIESLEDVVDAILALMVEGEACE